MARFNASTLLALVVLLVLISVDSCAALPTRRFATRRSIRPVLAKRSETGSLLQTVVHSLAKRWSATPRAVEYKHSVVVAARKIGYTQTTRQEEEEQYDEGAIPTGLWMPAVMKPQNPKMKRQEVIEQESMQNRLVANHSLHVRNSILTLTFLQRFFVYLGLPNSHIDTHTRSGHRHPNSHS